MYHTVIKMQVLVVLSKMWDTMVSGHAWTWLESLCTVCDIELGRSLGMRPPVKRRTVF